MGKGRSRDQAALPLEKPVMVRLTKERRATLSHRSAVIGHAIRGYKRKLSVDTRDTKKAIKTLEAERDSIDDALIADEELRAQGDLRFEGKTEATSALATVEAKAPLLSEPHAYISPYSSGGTGGDALPCDLCGSTEADPIHVVPAHTFVGDGSGEGRCRACARAKDDPVHGTAPAEGETTPAEGETPPPSSETPAAVEETFVCADCTDSGASPEASTHPKSEGVWIDHEGRKVCSNCRHAAIEDGRWPHEFMPMAPHRRKRGEAKCRLCEREKADPVHLVETGRPVPTEASEAADATTTPGEIPPAESVAIAKGHVTAPDPAFDFPPDEPPPNIIRTHAAVERQP